MRDWSYKTLSKIIEYLNDWEQASALIIKSKSANKINLQSHKKQSNMEMIFITYKIIS